MARKSKSKKSENKQLKDLENCDMSLSENNYKLIFVVSQSFRGMMYNEGEERLAPDFIYRAYKQRVNLLRFEPLPN